MKSSIIKSIIMISIVFDLSLLSAFCDIDSARKFSSSIIGEWIGTNQQVINDKKAPLQYFHLKIKEISINEYSSEINYFRLDDKTKKIISCGTSTITTSIKNDGNATSKILGNGSVYLDGGYKPENHIIDESFKMIGANSLQGIGKGKMSVKDISLNLGKNGKISKSVTTWSLSNNTLTIKQELNTSFSYMCFKKGYKVVSTHTARPGKDVSLLIKNKT